MIYSFTTYSPEQTIALGEQIGKRLCGGEVIAYSGGLGAGKTTIMRIISGLTPVRSRRMTQSSRSALSISSCFSR